MSWIFPIRKWPNSDWISWNMKVRTFALNCPYLATKFKKTIKQLIFYGVEYLMWIYQIFPWTGSDNFPMISFYVHLKSGLSSAQAKVSYLMHYQNRFLKFWNFRGTLGKLTVAHSLTNTVLKCLFYHLFRKLSYQSAVYLFFITISKRFLEDSRALIIANLSSKVACSSNCNWKYSLK